MPRNLDGGGGGGGGGGDTSSRVRAAVSAVRSQFGLGSNGNDAANAGTERAVRRSRQRSRRRDRGSRAGGRADGADRAADTADGPSVVSRAKSTAGAVRDRASRVLDRGDSGDSGSSRAGARGTSRNLSQTTSSTDTGREPEGESARGVPDPKSRAAAATVISERTGEDISADDLVKDGDQYRISEERRRELAAEQLNDQVGAVEVTADDVELQRDDGEVVAELDVPTQQERIEQRAAKEAGVDPEDVNVALTSASPDPEFETELTADGRKQLIKKKVREQGGLETEDGEFVEANPEDLEFDDEGNVTGVSNDGGGGGGGGFVDSFVDAATNRLAVPLSVGGEIADRLAAAEENIAGDGVGGATIDIAADTATPAGTGGLFAAVQAGDDAVGDQVRGFGQFAGDVSDSAATTTQEQVVEPIAGSGGQLRATPLPTGAFGGLGGGDGGLVVDQETSERVVESAGTGATEVTLGLPRDAAAAAAATEQAVGFTTNAIRQDGVVEGVGAAGEAGLDLGVAGAAQAEQQARADPAGTAGLVAGGLAGGAALGAAARGTSRVGGAAANRLDNAEFRIPDSGQFRRFIEDERGMADFSDIDGGEMVTKSRTKERERSEDPRLAGISEDVSSLEPDIARDIARQQLADEVPGEPPARGSAAVEQRAAELQLRLRARDQGIPFDEAVPPGQRVPQVEQVRSRMFEGAQQTQQTQAAAAARPGPGQTTATAGLFRGADQAAGVGVAAGSLFPGEAGTTTTASDFAPRPDEGQQVGQVAGVPAPPQETVSAFDSRPETQETDTDSVFPTPPAETVTAFDEPPTTDQDQTPVVGPPPGSQFESTVQLTPDTDLDIRAARAPGITPTGGPPGGDGGGQPRRGGVPLPVFDPDDEDRPFAATGEAETPFANPVVGGPEAFGVAGGGLFDGGADDTDNQPGINLI